MTHVKIENMICKESINNLNSIFTEYVLTSHHASNYAVYTNDKYHIIFNSNLLH